MTDVPFVAPNSLCCSFTPLTNTSKNPTLYVNGKLVCPAVAVAIPVVLAVGNVDQVTPTPVDLRNCPFAPASPKFVTFNLPSNFKSPRTVNLSLAVVVPIPTFFDV